MKSKQAFLPEKQCHQARPPTGRSKFGEAPNIAMVAAGDFALPPYPLLLAQLLTTRKRRAELDKKFIYRN
jgi:hypothetical protein